ncbi:hypothetical protein SAMN02745664_10766 [Moraxella cuniculi DSM 21768]|uniref:Uncharacterized protein n=1 Tax=Moraxella cuniculi DSM 21768 TaxID=1122245 RepID=A0A1N7EU17_9GAMM|nr:hypothetical protein [Moraxella cuniculi]OOS06344.1 hypothetical protein B0189_05515 [Moraxella cuniculi]SIR91445.1 hypothetical protein SAMN02745664_10766 [Moraxella cuniculi DSM 21768]
MLKAAILTTGLLFGTAALAETIDWTPALESLKNMCNQEAIYDSDIDWWTAANVPYYKDKRILGSMLSPSVVKSTVRFGKQVHHLKNATAFGLPITRFELDNGGNGMLDRVEIFFANNDFLKLRSEFYAVKDRGDNAQTVYANEKQAWMEYYYSQGGNGFSDLDYHDELEDDVEYLGAEDIDYAQKDRFSEIVTTGDGDTDTLSVYYEANGMGLAYMPENITIDGGNWRSINLTFDNKKNSIRCEYTYPPA